MLHHHQKNYLRTEATLSDNSSWSVSIADDGVATVKAQGTNSRNWLRYNSNDELFSSYSTGQNDVSIYLVGEELSNSQVLSKSVKKYYGTGTYTKKTQIDASNDCKADLATYFHGSVQLDRTTYYKGNALLMGDYDGGFDTINSGYGTDENGNMTHFKWNETTQEADVDYIVPKGNHLNWRDPEVDGMEGFYLTLTEMAEEGYFSTWESNTYNVTSKEDQYLKDFLAFTAPCLEETFLSSNYFTVTEQAPVTLKVEDKITYLSLQIILNEDNKGTVNNSSKILSEARVYAGNTQFVEEEYKFVKGNSAYILNNEGTKWIVSKLSITAGSDYYIQNSFGWEYARNSYGTAGNYDVVFDSSDYTLSVTLSKYKLAMASEFANGTVTTNPSLSTTLEYGTKVTFTLTPTNEDYKVGTFTIGGTSYLYELENNEYVYTVVSDAEVVIEFVENIEVEVAPTEDRTYIFSSYAAGTQYADNEVHVLDECVTVTTTDCHFTTQLRIYSSSSYDGYAIISSKYKMTSISVNAGNKVDTLNVYTSNDGVTWSATPLKINVNSTSYKDYTLDLGGEYQYLKLDVNGSNQVRIASMTISWN